MSQLYFNSHFSDYKNQVQHNKTAIILLWKQLAKKWPLQDTIHCNIELRTQSKKPRARGKWGDGKKFTFPTVLPPQHFYKGKQNQNSSIAFSGKLMEWGTEEKEV